MSTRANIIIKDEYDKLYFYRHSDGYPKGTMPTLNKFLEWVKEGKIRDNVSQAAGWLIILGAIEYQTISKNWITKDDTKPSHLNYYKDFNKLKKEKDDGITWKVGAYEPATKIYGDIAYLYVIDLVKKIIKIYATYEGDVTKEVKHISKSEYGKEYVS